MNAFKPGIDRIEEIEVFERIVERGSLTNAGIALGLSTPLISRRLSDLERRLGTRLFDRTSRILVLTERGREFHARAQPILLLIREAEAAVRRDSADLRGTLRVSLPTAAAESEVVAEFVALFHKHTDLCIEMRLSDRPVDVIGRGYDLAVYLTDAPDRHPGDIILGRHPTALAAAPSYLDRAGRPATPEDLLRHCTIRAVSSRGIPAEWQLTHADSRETVLPPSGKMFLSDEVRVLYTAVVCGAGIGRLPIGYIARAAKVGELEIVLPQWRFRPIMIAATLRRKGVRSAKVAALLELIVATLHRIEAFATSSSLESYFRD